MSEPRKPWDEPPATGGDAADGQPLVAAVVERLRQARRLGAALEGSLAELELSGAQFELLWACGRSAAPGLGQSELVNQTGLSAAHVSGLVEQLRQAGWLAGDRSACDRRRQVWRLTAAGAGQLVRSCRVLASSAAGQEFCSLLGPGLSGNGLRAPQPKWLESSLRDVWPASGPAVSGEAA